MADVIDRIFASLQEQLVGPLGDNLLQLIGPIWIIALVVAVLSLVFGLGSPQRGMKIGVLAALVVFGFVWFGYGAEIIEAITGNAPSADPAAAQAAAGPQSGGAAEGVRQIAQASLRG